MHLCRRNFGNSVIPTSIALAPAIPKIAAHRFEPQFMNYQRQYEPEQAI